MTVIRGGPTGCLLFFERAIILATGGNIAHLGFTVLLRNIMQGSRARLTAVYLQEKSRGDTLAPIQVLEKRRKNMRNRLWMVLFVLLTLVTASFLSNTARSKANPKPAPTVGYSAGKICSGVLAGSFRDTINVPDGFTPEACKSCTAPDFLDTELSLFMQQLLAQGAAAEPAAA